MKKLMKKKVNVFGKKLPVFMIALLGIAVVSAALITSWGTITGLVTVSRGLKLDGFNWDSTDASLTQTWDSFTSLEEKTLSSTVHYLDNTATVDAEFGLTTACTDNGAVNCDGDVETTVEYLLDSDLIVWDDSTGYNNAGFEEGREVITIILPEGTTLGNMGDIDFDEYVNNGYPASVNILLDVNDDKVFDSLKDLETGYLTTGADDVLKIEWAYNGGIDAGYLHADAYMNSDNSGYSTWLFGGMGTIDGTTNAWLYSGKPGVIGDTEFNDGTLAEWETGLDRGTTCWFVKEASGFESETCADVTINQNTPVYGIQIESLGFIAASSSKIKNIKVDTTYYEMSGLPAGEQTDFDFLVEFSKMLMPDDYTITTTVTA